jgi:hypothetical protein
MKLELCKKSPSVSPPISSAFVPYPLFFQWYPQSKEIFIKSGYEMQHLMHKVRE